jgi:hypothetical protein
LTHLGEQGNGLKQFNTAHGMTLDTRYEPHRLLICDRNHQPKGRLLHYSLDGEFIEEVVTGLGMPTSAAVQGDYVSVPDLHGRLVILDKSNTIMAVLGHNPDPERRANFNIPQEQWILRKMAIVVRAEIDDPAALIPGIRRELAALDPTIPAEFAVYSDIVAGSLSRHRLGAIVLVVFGLVSLTLAAVGTYGLISFSINQRFNEIAVRSAFGAERANLLKMFVTHALRLAAIGAVLGVGAAIAMRQAVASQLYETSALDPWVLALVPLTMLAVTLLASYLPARRASRIDVCAALREN